MTAPDVNQLDAFIDFLFGGLEGYVYLAASDGTIKEDGTKDWRQEFFEYPTHIADLKDTIRKVGKKLDVYLAPAIFKTGNNSLRSNVKASNVVWTEFDGNAPDWNDSNTPSLIVQSSYDNNQHVYWRLNEPATNVEVFEEINRRITYNMGADASAWDANQVLRPPESFNFKYGEPTPVEIIELSDRVYDIAVFNDLAPAPEQIEIDWKPEALPDANEVILSHAFGPDAINLLKKNKDEVTDRSQSLMNLAYICAGMGLTNAEIMVMLVLADDKWEKFKHREDRMKRLAHIIMVARNKYPIDPIEQTLFMAFGFASLLDTDISIDWLIDPMLMEQGFMLLVGPSGLGKTQFTLQFLIHLALGKDYLDYKMPQPKKVGFVSLEMGHGELKIFLEAMRRVLTDDEVLLLEKNFILVPLGEPLALNRADGQQHVVNFIESHELEVLAVDSIGSAIAGNISGDETVQPFTEFTDKIRNRYGIATWYIHHLRKSKDGPPTQDDVYGNQYIFNRSTSVYAMLKSKGGGIRIRNFKNRLAPLEKDYFVRRDENLNFHKESEGMAELNEAHLTNHGEDKPPSDKTGSGFNL